jgi:regulatory protein
MKTLKPVSIKSKALAFLVKREYGYHELFTKLQKYTDNFDEITNVLNELKQRGWLSEERFVNSYIDSKKNKYGPLKIRYNLLQKQVDPDLIQETLSEKISDEYKIAHEIWQRKFGVVPKDQNEKLKQVRFLQNRGFSFDTIIKVINNKIK